MAERWISEEDSSGGIGSQSSGSLIASGCECGATLGALAGGGGERGVGKNSPIYSFGEGARVLPQYTGWGYCPDIESSTRTSQNSEEKGVLGGY